MKCYLPRTRLLLMLLPIALDCFANMVIGGSWRNTLSGEAWNHRMHRWWGWCWKAIDVVFGKGHCQTQSEREARWGSVWRVWWLDMRVLPA